MQQFELKFPLKEDGQNWLTLICIEFMDNLFKICKTVNKCVKNNSEFNRLFILLFTACSHYRIIL